MYRSEDATQLVSIVYSELKRLAAHYMRQERLEHTLQPTALLHEALMRLQQSTAYDGTRQKEFCGAAAMRRVLIDYARRRKSEKRGGEYIRLELDQCRLPVEDLPTVDLLDLDEALDRLAHINARHAQVVHMRFFVGLSVQETAALLDVSPTTVKSDWRIARAWLLAQLESHDS